MKSLKESINNNLSYTNPVNESIRDVYNSVYYFIKTNDFLQKIYTISKEILKKSGKITIISILKLYYILIDKNTDIKDKLSIISVLMYLINPVDIIPDSLPSGFTDDIGLVLYLLNKLKEYDNNNIQKLAENKFNEWFNNNENKYTKK